MSQKKFRLDWLLERMQRNGASIESKYPCLYFNNKSFFNRRLFYLSANTLKILSLGTPCGCVSRFTQHLHRYAPLTQFSKPEAGISIYHTCFMFWQYYINLHYRNAIIPIQNGLYVILYTYMPSWTDKSSPTTYIYECYLE